MSNLVSIAIPGEPFGQPRVAQRTVRCADGQTRVVRFDPKEAKAWKAAAQWHMTRALRDASVQSPAFAGAVDLMVLAIFTCPASDHRKRDPRPRRWHTKKPDGDNVLKAVKDAAKGVLWLDDAQVAAETCIKVIGRQGEAPGVFLWLRALDTEAAPEPDLSHLYSEVTRNWPVDNGRSQAGWVGSTASLPNAGA